MTYPVQGAEVGDDVLRKYVVKELDRIIEEMSFPYNRGLIAVGLARNLRRVVRAWPDVTIHGGIE